MFCRVEDRCGDFFVCRMTTIRLGCCENPCLGYDDMVPYRGLTSCSSFQAYFALSLLLELGGSSLLPFVSLIAGLIGELFWVGLVVLALSCVAPYLKVLGSD